MNLDRLHEILAATTHEYRKGPEVERRAEGGVQVTEVFAMPHVSGRDESLVPVDVHFVVVGVDKAKAEPLRDEIVAVLRAANCADVDQPLADLLSTGPSYIAAGAAIGSQDLALRLYALGEVLGLWEVVTPERMGFHGEEARRMAGVGFVMTTGFTVEAATA